VQIGEIQRVLSTTGAYVDGLVWRQSRGLSNECGWNRKALTRVIRHDVATVKKQIYFQVLTGERLSVDREPHGNEFVRCAFLCRRTDRDQ
jgi:hypothetical protein